MDVDSPEFLLDPYPFYARKRAENPVFQRSSYEWTLTGYQALSEFLAHPAAGRGNIGQTPRPEGDTAELLDLKKDNLALQLLDEWMLFQNPPHHTTTRGRIADVFTLKVVTQLETSMRKTLRGLISEIQRSDQRQFDFARTLAYYFPLAVVCDLIGIPASDRERFFNWTRSFSIAVQVDFHRLDEEQRAELNQSAAEIQAYFEALIPAKQAGDADDLMTRFIEQNKHDMDAQQLLANCVFLLFAGQETTTSLMTNAVVALLRHPHQLQEIKEQPALMKNTVEECLRYDPSIQMVGRYALDNITLNNQVIEKGQHVFAFLGAAGRDPAVNSNPDKFDIHRKSIKHLAFTRGTHHCLGASLARLEIKVMLEELFAAFPQLSFAGKLMRRPTWLMRGFDSIPLQF